MPNGVKYSTTTPTGALRRGNVALGVTSNLGPTANTGFYSMPAPQSGKYIINKVLPSGIPNFFAPANDAELIRLARAEGAVGADTGSAAAVLAWMATQDNLEAVNFEYENIVTDGLISLLDASFVSSYPTTGTTWYDISGKGNNFTLYNGASLITDNNVKVISFDGIDDYARSNSTIDFTTTNQVTIVSVFSQINNTFGVMIYEHSDNWNQQRSSTGAGGTVTYGGFGMYTNSNGNEGGINNANQQHNQYNGNASYSGANRVGPGNTTYNIHTVIHNISLPGQDQTAYYGNGTLMTTTLPGSTTNYGANNTQNLGNEYMFLGKRGSSVPTGPYKLALLLIYNKALSQAEIIQNQNALKARYGL